jgi:hypothetical protein
VRAILFYIFHYQNKEELTPTTQTPTIFAWTIFGRTPFSPVKKNITMSSLSAHEKKRIDLQKKLKAKKGADEAPSMSVEEQKALLESKLKELKSEEDRMNEKNKTWDNDAKVRAPSSVVNSILTGCWSPSSPPAFLSSYPNPLSHPRLRSSHQSCLLIIGNLGLQGCRVRRYRQGGPR